ncbi:hypothetical protein B296_00051410, partial [Ensete ventricosum]
WRTATTSSAARRKDGGGASPPRRLLVPKGGRDVGAWKPRRVRRSWHATTIGDACRVQTWKDNSTTRVPTNHPTTIPPLSTLRMPSPFPPPPSPSPSPSPSPTPNPITLPIARDEVSRSLLHVVVAAGATAADEVGYTSPLHDPSTRDGDPPPPPTKQDVDGRSAAHSPRLLPRPPTHPPTRPPSPHHPYSWLDAKIASLFHLAPPPRPPRPVSPHSGFSRPDPGRRWMNPTAESSKSKGDRRRPRRRFSEEQIKSMESMFETQTKLEPRQKLQLARELGLQPRQVAIWFQNKRARWKSKQLEREYRALKADYDALLSSFDSLKKEKQLLLQQVTHRRPLVSPSSSFSVLLPSTAHPSPPQLQDLAELIDKAEERINRDDEGSNDRDSEIKKDQSSRLPLKEEAGLEFAVCGDEEDKKPRYFSQDELVLCAGHPASSSLTSSAEQQFCLTTSWPSDQSCNNSQWWEFWPLSE